MDQAVKVTPVIKSKFISHGTLGSKELEATRKFYEEFLGLEVVKTSPISMMVRLGSHHVYAVVQSRSYPAMDHLNHNGIDVDSDADVDESHRLCVEQAEKWGITKVSKPRSTHGTYCFHFVDLDGNDWEILSNPKGGYTWIFEKGDLEGKGHMDKKFRQDRPDA